jgi:hypothetical protein
LVSITRYSTYHKAFAGVRASHPESQAKIEQRVRSGNFKATIRDEEQTAALSPVVPETESTSFVLFLDPEEELSNQGQINSLVARIRKGLEDELIDADQMEYSVERVAGRDAAVITATGDAPAPAWTAESVRKGQLMVARDDGTSARAASTGILDKDGENSDFLYVFITLLVLFFIAWALLAASCCCGFCTDYSHNQSDRTVVVHSERRLAGKDGYLDDVSIYSSEYSDGYREADVDAEVYTTGVARNSRRGGRNYTSRGRNTEDVRFRDQHQMVQPALVPGASYATTIGGFPWAANGGQQQLMPMYQAPSMAPSTPAYIMQGQQQGSQIFYMPVSAAPSTPAMTPLAQEPSSGGFYYYQPVQAPYTPVFSPGPAVYSPPQYQPQFVQGQFQPQNVNERQVFYTYESAA